MAVSIKINKEDVSLEEIQFLFENPKNNFDIHFFDGTKGDYFELEIRGFQDGQESEAKKAVLEEIEKIRDVEFSIDDEEQYLRYQDSQDMQDFLSELKERERKENYAYIEKDNGEKIDISKNIRRKYLYREEISELILDREQEEGKLITNVLNIECSNSMISSIEAPEARSIYCENCENLETIKAPECEELHCENCPELKEKNMELSYDCEIEGLGKKNQLKR